MTRRLHDNLEIVGAFVIVAALLTALVMVLT
jgi:hypothetical protein